MKLYSKLLVGLAAMFISGQALATDFTIRATISSFYVGDDLGKFSTGKEFLQFNFTSAQAGCGGTVNFVAVYRNETPNTPNVFSEYIKTAQAAMLSGKKVNITQSNATGTCKIYYVGLTN